LFASHLYTWESKPIEIILIPWVTVNCLVSLHKTISAAIIAKQKFTMILFWSIEMQKCVRPVQASPHTGNELNLFLVFFQGVFRKIWTPALTTFFLIYCNNFLMWTSSMPEIWIWKLTAWFWCTVAQLKCHLYLVLNFPWFINVYMETRHLRLVQWRGFEKHTLSQSQEWWTYCFSVQY